MRIVHLLALLGLWLSALGGSAYAASDPISGMTLDQLNEARMKLDAKPEQKLLNACPVDANACTLYGIALMNGSPTLPKSPVDARQFFSYGCTKGDPAGCRALGMAQQGGLGGPVDLVGARSSYSKACDGRDAQGCARLGDMVALGKGGPADVVQGKALLNKACDYGAAKICSQLGRIVGSPVIMPKPAPSPSAPVVINTGSALTADQIINGDYSKTGPELAFKVACADKAIACTNYGLALMQGSPTLAKNEAEALPYFVKGCDQGDGVGCRYLGVMREVGRSTPKDLALARVAYFRACTGNDGLGCAKAGQFARHAMGGSADLKAALAYFRKGCDLKSGLACGALGDTLSSGTYMQADYPQALIFFKKACELGERAGCSDVQRVTGLVK